MSTAPLARDDDLRRLLDDGYDVTLTNGHLLVRHIPYVTTDTSIAYGFLTYPVTVSGDRVIADQDHRIWFGGTAPCNEHGRPLTLANPENRVVTADLAASFMLSSKPGPNGYPSQYEKVTAYARILSHPARALDGAVTATPGGAWQEVEEGLPFRYRDTATSRAGLNMLNRAFADERIVIVGLGGTGGYVLDQVAKTPVEDILLIDGDSFDNHNAFRAPGAPSLEQLRERPTKVAYFESIYSRMHTAIRTECSYLGPDNLALLDDATFVFLCLDDAEAKHLIAGHLLDRGISFVDVGMGVELVDGRLSGLLRMLFAPTGSDPDAVLARIPAPAEERDDYDSNVQVADLNAFNAMLAVGRWKRHLSYYTDGAEETLAMYSIYTNTISNETGSEEPNQTDESADVASQPPLEPGTGRGPRP